MSTIELKKPVPIDVGGHPAKIMWLAPTLQCLTTDRDGVSAWVEFHPAVDGVAGFAVAVPLANLSMHQGLTASEAFVEEVKLRARDHLTRELVLSQRDRDRREKEQKRLDPLQGMAQRLADELGK